MKREVVDIARILNNLDSRAKLQNFIDEAVQCKRRIEDEQESIRTLKDTAAEELGVDKKIFSSLVTVMHKNNFEEKKNQFDTLEEAMDLLSGGTYKVEQ